MSGELTLRYSLLTSKVMKSLVYLWKLGSLVNNEQIGISDDNIICPQEQDYNDALLVCNKLNIPLHRVDFIKNTGIMF